MIRRFLLIIAAVVIPGCTAVQTPKFQFPPDTRIGVLNHLESYVTHQHFSSLRFDSFSKTIDVEWNIPAYAEDKLISALKRDPRYTVIPIQPAEVTGGEKNQLEMIDRVSMSDRIQPEVAGFLNALAAKHRLDVIVIIKSFKGPSAFTIDKHPIELSGYGLATKAFLISKQAYAYANIDVIVFKTEPLVYIGSGKPRNKKSPLEDFDLSRDLRNLPRPEIDKLQPAIREYAEQAITNALTDANLILSE